MIHNELMEDSECPGECTETGESFSYDVNWTFYKCKKCKKKLEVVSPLHHWNQEQ